MIGRARSPRGRAGACMGTRYYHLTISWWDLRELAGAIRRVGMPPRPKVSVPRAHAATCVAASLGPAASSTRSKKLPLLQDRIGTR